KLLLHIPSPPADQLPFPVLQKKRQSAKEKKPGHPGAEEQETHGRVQPQINETVKNSFSERQAVPAVIPGRPLQASPSRASSCRFCSSPFFTRLPDIFPSSSSPCSSCSNREWVCISPNL